MRADSPLADGERQEQAGLSLRMVAYRELKRRIHELDLQPGRMMSDSELARQLGMSRTPVREALTLLERDHLITRIPNQGVMIREISIEDFLHALNMREAVDGMAARLSAGRMDTVLLDRLQAAFEDLGRGGDPGSAERHAELSRQLHGAIIAATRNPYIQGAQETLRGVFERTRQHSWRVWALAEDNAAISARRYDEHIAIIEALRHRDGEAAERAARAHISNAARDVLRLLAP